VSKLEFAVLCALMKITFHGKDRCFATNLEIAREAGLDGGAYARRSQVRIALHGRSYRKGRWDPEAGKWKRDGELVTVPGLCDPSRGFVEARRDGPSAPRELVLTPRWLEWGRVRLFDGGNGGPREEGTTAPVEQPSPAAPETAETGTAPAITPSATMAPTFGPAPAPVEQPSAEALAEVLGNHAREPRQGQAWQLFEMMKRRGARLYLDDNGSPKYEVGPGYDPLTGAERSVLRWLKPELVELLKAEAENSKPQPKAGDAPDGEKAAPRVVRPAEIRAMIARLTGQPAADDSDCRALARRIVGDPGFAHNDADPATSEATYFGLACDTKRGALGQVVMTEAFEAARKPKVRNRGAMLVAVVKGLKAGMRKPDPDHQGGPTS
jgi:hypothetical protein